MISMADQATKLLYSMANLHPVIQYLLDVCLSELDAGTDWPLGVEVPPCSEACKQVGVRRKIKESLTSLTREKCKFSAVITTTDPL